MADQNLLRYFYGGFIRLHILHHAALESICGVEMVDELKRHGYVLGPGTIYPILHDLERSGYLLCETEVVRGKRRKNYRITKKGAKLLQDAQMKLRELTNEVLNEVDENRDSVHHKNQTRR